MIGHVAAHRANQSQVRPVIAQAGHMLPRPKNRALDILQHVRVMSRDLFPPIAADITGWHHVRSRLLHTPANRILQSLFQPVL